MSDEIHVLVKSNGSGRCLAMYYVDPISGKRVVKSAGTKNQREAERAAGEWEKELQQGGGNSPSKITWAEFRERYETEHLATLAPRTRLTVRVDLDCLERVLAPDRLCKLTSAVMSKFQAELRKPKEVVKNNKKVIVSGMKETTIAKTLRHIKAALRWGEKMGLIAKAPSFVMPKRAKGQSMMKGRPVTGEEFDRMIMTVPKVRPNDAVAWQQYLTGLWLSGLRLTESIELSWNYEAPFCIDLSGKRPVFRIHGSAQKSGRDEILPMTPDFAEWLQATFPESERVGKVFNLFDDAGKPLSPLWVSKEVADIGEIAGVIVNKQEEKYASAHDLRRAFGTRWAKRVTTPVLQRLMRHGNIQTTLNYYVNIDATDIADGLWATYEQEKPQNGNTRGNTQQNRATDPCSVNDVSP